MKNKKGQESTGSFHCSLHGKNFVSFSYKSLNISIIKYMNTCAYGENVVFLFSL